jgi:hypothetical protein
MIYALDFNEMAMKELILKGSIIDYSYGLDDYVYVMTGRYLYKIDQNNLLISDRIPLPQRYNYLTIDDKNILLITTDEIVIIDKQNLAFKTGIGIEKGDYRPITSQQRLNIAKGKQFVYLITDTKKKTILKIFDLNNGKLFRQIKTNKILFYEHDPVSNTITVLDINNKIKVYDKHLNAKKIIHLKFAGKWFNRYQNSYVLYNPNGIFLVNKKGKLLDFQPISINANQPPRKDLFLANNGLVYLDLLTLRPKYFFPYTSSIKNFYPTDSQDFVIIADLAKNFHIVNLSSLQINPILKKKIAFKKIIPPKLKKDSLWYFQVGAFSNHDNALETYNNIKLNGLPALIDSADLYRVKIGGFLDKTIALNIIEKEDLNGWFVYQKKISFDGIKEFYINQEKYIFKDGVIRKE